MQIVVWFEHRCAASYVLRARTRHNLNSWEPLFTDAAREVRERLEMALGQLIELATVPLTAGAEDDCNIGYLHILDSVRVSAMRGG
jgi:hypothetical protein